MQLSIPWISFCHWNDDNHPFFEAYCDVFIRCTTALTRCHSLPFVVTLCHWLSLFVTRYHSLSLVVTLCHLLSLFVTRCTTRCHSLSFVITRCHSLYHSLLLVVPLVVTCCTTRCHSLSLDVPLVCLFISDQKISRDLKICISVPLIQIKTWLVKKLFMVYTENRNRLPHYILLSHILHMNSKLNFWK